MAYPDTSSPNLYLNEYAHKQTAFDFELLEVLLFKLYPVLCCFVPELVA